MNKIKYQYSARDARPEKTTYFLKQRTIASLKVTGSGCATSSSYCSSSGYADCSGTKLSNFAVESAWADCGAGSGRPNCTCAGADSGAWPASKGGVLGNFCHRPLMRLAGTHLAMPSFQTSESGNSLPCSTSLSNSELEQGPNLFCPMAYHQLFFALVIRFSNRKALQVKKRNGLRPSLFGVLLHAYSATRYEMLPQISKANCVATNGNL